jgi:putative chitinase
MIAPDRQGFFAAVRETLFRGSMSQSQVDGCSVILQAWDDFEPTADPRFVAYSFATAFWETDRTMQPIAEIGRGAGKPYGRPDGQFGQVYFGRGFVQLTWLANYVNAAKYVGGDLVAHPDNALKPDIAAKILVWGMTKGWFTGRRLANYFDGTRSDWTDARRIINGVDRAALIAGFALHFLHAIEG